MPKVDPIAVNFTLAAVCGCDRHQGNFSGGSLRGFLQKTLTGNETLRTIPREKLEQRYRAWVLLIWRFKVRDGFRGRSPLLSLDLGWDEGGCLLLDRVEGDETAGSDDGIAGL